MSARKAEIETAVVALGGGGEADQLGLALASPELARDDVLNEPAAAVAVRRGRGRPPGARNRRTAEMVEFCERVLGEPLLVKAFRIVGTDTRALAKGLSCSRLDAFRLQAQVLLGALPYAHQKLPLAVDVHARVAVPLSINLGGGTDEPLAQAVERAATVLDLLPDEMQAYQELSEDGTGHV